MRDSGSPICLASSCLSLKLKYLLLVKADSRASFCQSFQTVFLRRECLAKPGPPTSMQPSILPRMACQESSSPWRIYSEHLQNKQELPQVPGSASGGCEPCPLNTSASAPVAPPTPKWPWPIDPPSCGCQAQKRHTCHVWHLRTEH